MNINKQVLAKMSSSSDNADDLNCVTYQIDNFQRNNFVICNYRKG
ncbi:hypothetical protein E2C01_042985 [Portunus trituberculatus]|uniref:Uncharacterized protein n=1 Tax=Portunus trituberculatus TaxID=210409 RepID=A0A5B7FNA5_PORTR|nr:hypothetical protein [Portunus trituberculatus]